MFIFVARVNILQSDEMNQSFSS